MNVDWPRAKSSLAPMREKTLSIRPMRADFRRHIGAHLREDGDQGDLPDIGRFSRHIGPGEENELAGSVSSMRIVRDEMGGADGALEQRDGGRFECRFRSPSSTSGRQKRCSCAAKARDRARRRCGRSLGDRQYRVASCAVLSRSSSKSSASSALALSSEVRTLMLVLFQLLCDIPFSIDERLAPLEPFGNIVSLRAADLDVVAEGFGKADL